MLIRSVDATYESLRATFSWDLPAHLNIGAACADRQDGASLALVEVVDGVVREHTFGALSEQSNRLANGLRRLGVTRGDRVAIMVPQGLTAGLAHLAVYKLGAVAVPLTTLFGPDAVRFRLGDSDARAVIVSAGALDVLDEVRADLPGLAVVVDGEVSPPLHRLADLLTGRGGPPRGRRHHAR